MARGPPSLDTAPDTTFKGGSRPKSEEQPHAIAGRSLGNYAASWCSGPGGISGCNGLSAAAIERVALTKTWVLDKLIENVDRAHRSRWSPRARGEGWGPIIRLYRAPGFPGNERESNFAAL